MNKFFLLIFFLCSALTACKQKPATKSEGTSGTDSVAASDARPNPGMHNCEEDTTVKYLMYVPEKAKEELPLIIFFDPSGNAGLPIIKYKEIADKMGLVIAGSMNSRNGQTIGQSVYFGKTILNDILHKNKIDRKRIFVAGFSGGARVATRLAEMNPEIKAVIGNSAGFENTSGYYPSFGFVGVGGTGDMNMLELVNLHKYLKGSKTPHMLLMFDGIHEWAPVKDMEKAMLWMLCLTNSPVAEQQLDALEPAIKHLADSLEMKGKLMEAATEWETLIGCSNFLKKENKSASENYQRIQKLPAFPAIQREMASIWSTETAEQNRLMAGFGKWPTGKWISETDALTQIAQEKTQAGFLNRRLLGFLSLACLSSTNRGFANKDTAESGYYSAVYTIVDPNNPEAWFLRSLHHARTNHPIEARVALATAQTKGFNDQARVISSPELMQVLNQQ